MIKTIIEKGHTSTLEHSLITFDVKGISRALLQELSRHRVGVSPSVESTRYTFKRILNGSQSIEDVLVSCGDKDIDELNIQHMKKLKKIVMEKQLHNDIAKYGIVEAYKVDEQISFNIRSFRHFYQLRKSKKALKEIQNLAGEMMQQIPPEYNVFFTDLIGKNSF